MSYFDIYGESPRPQAPDVADFPQPPAPEPDVTPVALEPEPLQPPAEAIETPDYSLFSWLPSFNTSMIILIIFAIIGALYTIYIFRDVIYASLEEVLIYFGIIEAPVLLPDEPEQEEKESKKVEKGKYCVVGRNENGVVCVPYTNQRDCNSKEYVNESDCVNL